MEAKATSRMVMIRFIVCLGARELNCLIVGIKVAYLFLNSDAERFAAGRSATSTALPKLHASDVSRRIYLVYLAVRGERTADLRRALVQDAATATFAARKAQWIPLPEREL